MTLKKSEIKNLSVIGAVVAALFSTNVIAAIQLEHSGAVELGTEYHSNLQFLDDSVEESVTLYNLIPEYKITALDDKNLWSAKLGVLLQRSSNDDISGNREDPFANIGWEHDFESSKLVTEASYNKQSSRNTQFSETGVTTEDGTTVTKKLSADWAFALSDKWTVSLLAAYQKNIFSGVSLLSDYDNREYGTSASYLWSERFQPYARVTFNDYRANSELLGNNRIKYQKYIGGAVMQLGSKLSLDVNTGLATFNSDGKDTWIGEAVLAYAGGRYDITSTFATEVFPTGLNRIQVGDKWNTDFAYELSERSRWGVGVGFSRNNSGLKTQELEGFYKRELSPSWLFTATAGFKNLNAEGRASADDKAIGLSVIYNSPKF